MDTWFVKSRDLCYELISLPSIASKNRSICTSIWYHIWRFFYTIDILCYKRLKTPQRSKTGQTDVEVKHCQANFHLNFFVKWPSNYKNESFNISSNSNNVCIFDIVLRKKNPHKLKTYPDLGAQSSMSLLVLLLYLRRAKIF